MAADNTGIAWQHRQPSSIYNMLCKHMSLISAAGRADYQMGMPFTLSKLHLLLADSSFAHPASSLLPCKLQCMLAKWIQTRKAVRARVSIYIVYKTHVLASGDCTKVTLLAQALLSLS